MFARDTLIRQEDLDTVKEFFLLDSIVPERDVIGRIAIAPVVFVQHRHLNKTESQIIWSPYIANSNLWCGGLDATITGDNIFRFLICVA